VRLIAYTDTAGRDRRVYRLRRHGVFIGEYQTPEELGKAVDLAALVEDDPGQGRDAAQACSHGRGSPGFSGRGRPGGDEQ